MGHRVTKVNRSITEGRAAFLKRLDGIQSGAECERLAPLLSALADGEASAEDMSALRPHLRGCLACRATLREYRAAPGRVAAVLPGSGLLAGGDASGGIGRWLASLVSAVSDRASSVALKAQSAVEIASAQKLVAVAASTAVLAGNGVATVKSLERTEPAPARAKTSAARGQSTAMSATAPADAVAVSAEAHYAGATSRPRERVEGRHGDRQRPEQEPRAAGAETTEFDPTGTQPETAAPAPGGAAKPRRGHRSLQATRPAPSSAPDTPAGRRRTLG